MPHAAAPARNPPGAVTPPSTGRSATRFPSGNRGTAVFDVFDVTGTIETVLPFKRERQRHGVLAAASEERTGRAVTRNLLWDPLMRDHREVLLNEEPRVVRERRERVVSIVDGAAPQLIQQPRGDALAASPARHDERSHFGHRALRAARAPRTPAARRRPRRPRTVTRVAEFRRGLGAAGVPPPDGR